MCVWADPTARLAGGSSEGMLTSFYFPWVRQRVEPSNTKAHQVATYLRKKIAIMHLWVIPNTDFWRLKYIVINVSKIWLIQCFFSLSVTTSSFLTNKQQMISLFQHTKTKHDMEMATLIKERAYSWYTRIFYSEILVHVDCKIYSSVKLGSFHILAMKHCNTCPDGKMKSECIFGDAFQ